MREVDNATAHELMSEQSRPYIDVRTPAEFAEGHPAGAINIPISMGFGINPDFVDILRRLYPADTALLLGCRTGGRSASACQVLERAGYTDVTNVAGGFVGIPSGPFGGGVPGWRALGLPSNVDGKTYVQVLDQLAD
ncbi:MAG: rhodanese-like domain-containing protein [Proteobacteria bacterium]|nr:rhodanese-like domain-containing protein [Pseudomonadota bacterium]